MTNCDNSAAPLRLARVDVDPARATRIRHRAHAALQRSQRAAARHPRPSTWWVTPSMVASVSVVFLVEILRRAMWLWTP